MKFFWFLWIIDLVTALITLYFFFVGIADGSVSSFNMALWLILLVVLAAVLFGGWLLKSKGRIKLANLILCLLAVPALFYALFMAVVIFSGARWN